MSNTKRNRASASADRLSDLPEDLLRQILSFLPTFDVIRMSLVSKRFRNIWLHIPVLNFEGNWNRRYDFVNNYLGRRIQVPQHEYFNNITEFILGTDYDPNDGPYIDRCLHHVLQMGVKELVLDFQPHLYDPYDEVYMDYRFPEFLLVNNNATSLTRLELCGVGLRIGFHISLPSLTSLSLFDVDLEEEEEVENENSSLRSLVSGCPNIEYLHWERLHKQGVGVDHICYIDHNVCGAIKVLSLDNSDLTDKWLEDIVSGLPLLESITLGFCHGLKQFTIRSQSLKSFYFRGNRNENVETTLFTPNLVYFYYKGRANSIFSMSSPNLLEQVVVKLASNRDDRSWYLDLLRLLSNLNCSNTMVLYLPSEKALLFPKHMRKKVIQPCLI